MKNFAIALVVLFLSSLASAQGAMSFPAPSTAMPCITFAPPTVGQTIWCGDASGPQVSINGGGYMPTMASIAIGTTTTGAAGTSAKVTNSGTASQAVFNFTIPAGAQGPPGPAGTVPASFSCNFTVSAGGVISFTLCH